MFTGRHSPVESSKDVGVAALNAQTGELENRLHATTRKERAWGLERGQRFMYSARGHARSTTRRKGGVPCKIRSRTRRSHAGCGKSNRPECWGETLVLGIESVTQLPKNAARRMRVTGSYRLARWLPLDDLTSAPTPVSGRLCSRSARGNALRERFSRFRFRIRADPNPTQRADRTQYPGRHDRYGLGQ